MDPVTSPRAAGPDIPHRMLAAVGLAILVAVVVLQGGRAAPAPPGPLGTEASVAGRACTVYADSPRLVDARAGLPVVTARVRVGECHGGDVSGVTLTARLQACTPMSYGCLWHTVATRAHDVLGTDERLPDRGLLARRTSRACVAGRYRVVGEVTVYASGDRGSARDVSTVAELDC